MESARIFTYLIINVMNGYMLNFLLSNVLGIKEKWRDHYLILLCVGFGIIFLINIFNIQAINVITTIGVYIGIILFLYKGNWWKKLKLTCLFILSASVAEIVTLFILQLGFDAGQIKILLQSDYLYLITALMCQLTYLVLIMLVAKLILKNLLIVSWQQLLAYLTIPITTIILLKEIFGISMQNMVEVRQLKFVFFSAIAIVLANLLIFNNFYRFSLTQQQVKQLALAKQQMDIEQRYYQLLDCRYQKNRRVIHDINNHLACISGLVHTGDKKEILHYVHHIYNEIKDLSYTEITGNRVIDIILNQKLSLAEEYKTEFSLENSSCYIGKINDIYLCTLIGNILDNALEATKNSSEGWIDLQLYNEKNYLVLELRNSCDKKPILINGALLTRKKDKENHGIGMQNVKQVVEAYEGRLEYQYNENNLEFWTYVALRIDKEVIKC